MNAAIFTLLGAAIGAVLQYFFTRHIESQKHYRGLRTQAYTDYVRCVCEHAQLVPKALPNEIREIFARTTDAKTRICLYGSTQAVEAFATCERMGAQAKSKDGRRAFTTMMAIMRKDSGSSPSVQIESLEIVLWGHREADTPQAA